MDYPFSRYTLMPFLRHFISETTGLENLPKNDSFIVAANHVSATDPLFIISTLFKLYHKKIHFIANPGKYNKVFKKFISRQWGGCILLDRKNPQIALEEAINKLAQEKIVGIFPEGLRIHMGDNLSQGRTGVIRLALAAKKPIIPIGIVTNGEPQQLLKTSWAKDFKKRHPDLVSKHNRVNTALYQVINPQTGKRLDLDPTEWLNLTQNILSDYPDVLHKYFLQGERSRLNIGKPISLDQYYDQPITKTLLRSLTDSVMQILATLSYKQYNH